MVTLVSGLVLLAIAHLRWLPTVAVDAWPAPITGQLAVALGAWVAAVVSEFNHDERIARTREHAWVAGSLVLFGAALLVALLLFASPWNALLSAAAAAVVPVLVAGPEADPAEPAKAASEDPRAGARAFRPGALLLSALWFGCAALVSASEFAPVSALPRENPSNPRDALYVEMLPPTLAGDATRVMGLLARDPAVLNHPGHQNATLLHHACQSGRGEVVRQLLLKGANPNARDDEGRTPLHSAMHGSNTAQQTWIVRMLKAKDVELNAVDRHGLTALGMALYRDRELVALLRELGAR